MFGLSKIQTGMLVGAALVIASLAAYAKHATQQIGQHKQVTASLKQAAKHQQQQIDALATELDRRDEILTQVQQERDALAKRKAEVVTKWRTVRETPEVAECGDTRLPDELVVLMRDYQAGDDNGGADSSAAQEPDPAGS